MSKITVATTFSGIGAFEQALKKLKIPHDIAFLPITILMNLVGIMI